MTQENELGEKLSAARDLKTRTKQFALRVIQVFRALPRDELARIIGRQMLRAGTSVAANYRAACRARSRREFVAKIGVVLEEADESAFWPELLVDAGIVASSKLGKLIAEAYELVAIFAASYETAKNGRARPPAPNGPLTK